MEERVSRVRYRLYGLSVEADLPLPGLSPTPASTPPDVTVHLGHAPADAFPPDVAEEPWYASPRATPAEEPALLVHRDARGGYRLRYADGIEFRVDAAGARVAATWPPRWTLADAAVYLTGSVCGLLLRLRGIPALHASAVALGDRAIAFTGPAGAGKSTTAAAFTARGFPLLADDISPVLDGPPAVQLQPAYPQLRLWPDVIPAVHGGELPPLTPNWEKRFLALDERGFRGDPLPLAAVYVLAGREALDTPRLEPIPPVEAVLTLVANTYLGWFPDPTASGRALAVLGRLARTVPLVRLVAPDDPARLAEVVRTVERDFLARRGGARAHHL